ncbi:MAG: hypothetical protein FWD60_00950 [Candidatus Azobacteroides sp.]|nr:hypothetical protein [Candidatus Azobacteroides sp.]
MSTATIISNIQKLPLTEQHFVVEQVLNSIRNVEQKQAGFMGMAKSKEIIAKTSGVDIDEAFKNCFDLLSELYGVDTRALAEKYNFL